MASGKPLVVEIGPGYSPFPPATEFIDWKDGQLSISDIRVHCLDINKDRLPYEDKSVDFIYCRHVLEDIYNPLWVCEEMARVAKAGYIETPSPLAECSRGVDADSPNWRGYVHHRYVVWVHDGKLTFLPKYPIIEHFNLMEVEDEIIELLNSSPLYWNTYFFWNDSFEVNFLQSDQDFNFPKSYQEWLMESIARSTEDALLIALNYGFPVA
ncbi:methyltransferase domain-containing protein [Tumidithrix elongata RA019]|uniref:Methyltransferase domain-containing protein n=1 Tax=Tumidithrix elongata BACA0141 TaxID=2716417 RepID=A0AAW9PZN4_9CYAN|nr:methyltransferase domain-containing protein [Tumidithrix elongata RA019]